MCSSSYMLAGRLAMFGSLGLRKLLWVVFCNSQVRHIFGANPHGMVAICSTLELRCRRAVRRYLRVLRSCGLAMVTLRSWANLAKIAELDACVAGSSSMRRPGLFVQASF